MIHHPGNDLLDGVKLHFHPLGQFGRQFPDPRIIGLHLLRRSQIILHDRIDLLQREGCTGLHFFKPCFIQRVTGKTHIDDGRRLRPGGNNDLVAPCIRIALPLLGFR